MAAFTKDFMIFLKVFMIFTSLNRIFGHKCINKYNVEDR